MNGFLGVSLGSRRFSRDFFERLPVYLKAERISDLSVVVFDHAEVWNYMAFSGYDRNRAERIAENRGKEVARMIERAVGTHGQKDVHITVQRSSLGRHVIQRARVAELLLKQVREKTPSLREELVGYVLDCAQGRLAKHPPAIHDAIALAASDYLLVEAAWSWAYVLLHKPNVEIYPGPCQPFKTKVLAGLVPGAADLLLASRPRFLDCSHLQENHIRHGKAA